MPDRIYMLAREDTGYFAMQPLDAIKPTEERDIKHRVHSSKFRMRWLYVVDTCCNVSYPRVNNQLEATGPDVSSAVPDKRQACF